MRARRPDPDQRRRPPRRAARPLRRATSPRSTATGRPKVVRNDDGSDVWVFNGAMIPNIGLNAVAGRPKEEYGIEPTAFDEMRPGLLRRRRARQGHERRRGARLDVLPVVPRLQRPAVRRRRRQGPRPRRACGPTTTGTSTSGAAPTPAASSRWASRCCGTPSWPPTRCAAWRRRACTRSPSPRTRRRSATRASTTTHWDPLWKALCDDGRVLSIHLGSSGQLAVTAPDAPIDVMITLQPMNICAAAADLLWSRVLKEFPDHPDRAVRGRHRLDPVLPRPPRPHLRHAPPVDGSGLRRPAAERGVPRALPHLLHRRSRSASSCATTSASTTSRGSATTRTRDSSWPERARGAGRGRRRRARRRPRQDHARERHARGTRSTRSPTAPKERVHGRRAAGRGRGPRRDDPSLRQGPLREASGHRPRRAVPKGHRLTSTCVRSSAGSRSRWSTTRSVWSPWPTPTTATC